MGKGNKPNHAEPLSPYEEERLWTSGILDVNSSNPATLQNTMWFWNAKLLGLRGADEHRQMQWGDLTFETDVNNKPFLQFNERTTKTRTGQHKNIRPFQPTNFPSQNPERCPIVCYKNFMKARPQDFSKKDSPFYLEIKYNRKNGDVCSFKKIALEEKMGGIFKKMCSAAGIMGEKNKSESEKQCEFTAQWSGPKHNSTTVRA